MKINNIMIIPDKDNIETSLAIAKDCGCGFEYNDFYIPALLDDEELLRDTINFYKDIEELPEYCTCHGAFFDVTIFSDDARIQEVSDYRVEQSLKIAEALGVKAIVFHTNYTPNFLQESYRRNWVERNYKYWSEKLEKYPKLNIYIENMFDTDWILISELACRLKDKSNFGICFDYAHACVFGDEHRIDEWVAGISRYVKHVHINDNDFKSDLHLALGDGCIDWHRFCRHYKDYFPNASVLIEMRGEDKIRKSLEYLRTL